MSIWVLKRFNRRHVLLFGHVTCFLSQIVIGALIQLKSKIGLVIATNIYCFVYNISNAGAGYLYSNEISTDIAMAVVFTMITILLFIQSTFFFSSMNLLTREGYFYFYSVWSLLGFFFVLIFCGETKGLTDIEKKELFCPGAKYGRKLKIGEACAVSPRMQSRVTKKQMILKHTTSIGTDVSG